MFWWVARQSLTTLHYDKKKACSHSICLPNHQVKTVNNKTKPLSSSTQKLSRHFFQETTIFALFSHVFVVGPLKKTTTNHQPIEKWWPLQRGLEAIGTSDWYMVGFKIPRMPSGNFKFKAFRWKIPRWVSFCAWKKKEQAVLGWNSNVQNQKGNLKKVGYLFSDCVVFCLWVRVFITLFLLGEGERGGYCTQILSHLLLCLRKLENRIKACYLNDSDSHANLSHLPTR